MDLVIITFNKTFMGLFSKITRHNKSQEKVRLEVKTTFTKRIEILKSDFEKELFHDIDFETAPLNKIAKDNEWTINSEFKEI